MKRTLSVIIGVVLLAVGCQTIPGTGRASPPANTLPGQSAQSVQAVIQAHVGQEMDFFDKDGKKLAEFPQHQRGSVSILNRDHTGQDNYAFDEHGVVVRHQCSQGADYGQGVWREVK